MPRRKKRPVIFWSKQREDGSVLSGGNLDLLRGGKKKSKDKKTKR